MYDELWFRTLLCRYLSALAQRGGVLGVGCGFVVVGLGRGGLTGGLGYPRGDDDGIDFLPGAF